MPFDIRGLNKVDFSLFVLINRFLDFSGNSYCHFYPGGLEYLEGLWTAVAGQECVGPTFRPFGGLNAGPLGNCRFCLFSMTSNVKVSGSTIRK